MNRTERITRAITLSGKAKSEIAKLCGVAPSAVTQWVNGDSKSLKAESVFALAKATGFNALWLAVGEGPEQDIDNQGSLPSEEDYALIPQYTAKGACGDGYLNDHVEIRGGLAFKRDWLKRMGAKPENLFVIYADGDSMEPFIFEGDVVLFDSADCEPQDRQVYAFRRPAGGISIKRLSRQLSGAWMIRSDNQDKARHPDEQVSDDAMHDMPILGRVIWRGGAM